MGNHEHQNREQQNIEKRYAHGREIVLTRLRMTHRPDRVPQVSPVVRPIGTHFTHPLRGKIMPSAFENDSVSKKRAWAGRIVSALPALFLLVDGGMKLVKPVPVVEATVRLGYPESVIFGLGILLLACTVVYLVPRTSILGAILLTGYLGGAVATHVRVGDGLFPIFFPVILGVLVWGGLFLRDNRLRTLPPWRSSADAA